MEGKAFSNVRHCIDYTEHTSRHLGMISTTHYVTPFLSLAMHYVQVSAGKKKLKYPLKCYVLKSLPKMKVL